MRKLLFLTIMLASITASAQQFYLFVGTYTANGSKGIYVYEFDAATGTAKWVSNTDSITNPSYLAVAPNKKYVYAVIETNGTNPGKLAAFSFDSSLGTLHFINQQVTGGDDPCYVSVSSSNKWIMVANYSGGSVSVFSANDDGSLNPRNQLIQHTGKSVNAQRQEKAHVHAAVFSPDEHFVFTPDLGMDRVFAYSFNPDQQEPLSPAPTPYTEVIAGNGPRHLTFHPNKRFAYLVEEMGGAVVAYQYNNGRLSKFQQIETHPAGFKGDIGSADIHISPDGKFLYASNRGDENTLTIFAINSRSGKLTLKGYQPTLGKTPRNFVIDPTGNYLLVANQNTNNVVVFKRNKKTGMLTQIGKGFDIPNPVCLQMIRN